MDLRISHPTSHPLEESDLSLNESTSRPQTPPKKVSLQLISNRGSFDQYVKFKLDAHQRNKSPPKNPNATNMEKLFSFRMAFLAKNVELDTKPKATLDYIGSSLIGDESVVQDENSPTRSKQLVLSNAHFKRKSTFLESYNERLQASLQTRQSIEKAKRESVNCDDSKIQDLSSSAVKANQSISRRTDYTSNRAYESGRGGMKFLSQGNSLNVSLLSSPINLADKNRDDSSYLLPEEKAAAAAITEESVKQLHTKVTEEEDNERDPSSSNNDYKTIEKEKSLINSQGVRSYDSETDSIRQSRHNLEKRSSRNAETYSHTNSEVKSRSVPRPTVDQLEKINKIETEVKAIHFDLLRKLEKYHIPNGFNKNSTSQGRAESSLRAKRSISANKSNSFRRASLGGVNMNGTHTSNTSMTQSTAKRRKQRITEIREFPEWLKGRDDFKSEFGRRGLYHKKHLISICEKLYLILKSTSLISHRQSPYSRTSDEINEIASWLRNVRIIRHFPNLMLELLASKVRHRFYQKDEILCHQGDVGNCLYIVYDGAIKCLINGTEVGVYHAGQAVGQAALEGPSQRASTLVATVPTSILRLDRDDYKNALEQCHNQEKNEYFFLLNEIKVIQSINDKKKKIICSCLQSRYFSKGETIYERGDDSEWFYILKNGQLQLETKISIEKGNIWPIGSNLWEKSKLTRKMKFKHDILPNQYFGEVELIDNCKRLTKVTCVENSQVLLLHRKNFFELFNTDELRLLKRSLQSSVLDNVDQMKEKVLEDEKAKRKIKEISIQALMNCNGGARETDIFRPKSHSLEPVTNQIQRDFNNYLRKNTVKTSKTREVMDNNLFED